METASNATSVTSSSSLHPLLWIAGISVTLLSVAGIASLTGILPTRAAPVAQPPAILAAAPATEVAIVLATPAAAPLVTPQALVEIHRKAAKKKVEQKIAAVPAAFPSPSVGGVPPDYAPPPAVALDPPAAPACPECGVIANVQEVTHEAKGTGAGAIVGGLAGGVLGSNVGRGNTRTLAAIAGAIGGGLLGNTIEKSRHKTVSYQVTVHMEDGTTRLIDSEAMPSWRIGDTVKLVGGAIVSR